MTENFFRNRNPNSSAVNLLDLASLPPAQVFIVQTVLKKINASQAELWDEVLQASPEKHMDRETFEETLEMLVESKWLWQTGEGTSAIYSGRLKRQDAHMRMPMEMTRTTGRISTSTWKMLEAKETIEADREKATGATPTIPRTFLPAQGLLGWFSGTKQILLIMLMLSAINFFAVASIDVTGVSGFVETLGVKNLPWISIIEMLFGLLTSAIYIRYADRIPSLRLIKFILVLLVGIYAATAALFYMAKFTHLLDGLAALFNLKEDTALLYPLLYLLRSQQIIIFPIAFWNLANSLYSMTDARKVFPVIASGEMIGGLIGYALFTEFFGRNALFTQNNAFELLVFCGILYLFILLVIHSKMKAPDEDEHKPPSESFVKNFKNGLETIRAVPLFRYLALTVALTWVTLPILEYHFYTSIDSSPGAETGSFQNFYSIYSIALTLFPLILQWRIVPDLTKRVEIRNAFLVLPAMLAIGALALSLISGLYVAAVIVLFSYTIYSSWDSPMMNTVQYLVPQERRARVGALLNNYAYAFGKIFGSLVLGLILAFGTNALANSYIYLTLALVAALVGLGTAIMVRLTYETSMLSWRVARRARSASVFDKLSDL